MAVYLNGVKCKGAYYNGQRVNGYLNGTQLFNYNPVNVSDPSVYGVRSSGGSNPNMTRTDAAVGLVAGVNGARNDFDTRGPWAHMKRVTDSLGNVFVTIPKLYIRKTKTGSGTSAVYTWQVSLQPHSGNGWYMPKCFWNFNTNSTRPYILVGAYDASNNSNNTLASKTGVTLTEQSITQARQYARNNGAGYQILDVTVWDVIQTLMFVEFATFNLLGTFGMSSSNAYKVVNGSLDNAKGSSSSNTSSGVDCYRGIENIDTNVGIWLDGINEDTNNNVWVCSNPQQYQTNLFGSPYQKVYHYSTELFGWVNDVLFDSNNPEVSLPINVMGFSAGSLSSYFCAYAVVGYGSDGFSAWDLVGDGDGLLTAFDGDPSGSIGARLVKEPM